MPKSRIDFIRGVLERNRDEETNDACLCPRCIEYLATELDEAVTKHREQFRGDGPSMIEELKSTPEGLAAYNRARADLVREAEILEKVVERIERLAQHYDSLTITYQDRTSITVAQIKRQAILEVAEKIKEG